MGCACSELSKHSTHFNPVLSLALTESRRCYPQLSFGHRILSVSSYVGLLNWKSHLLYPGPLNRWLFKAAPCKSGHPGCTPLRLSIPHGGSQCHLSPWSPQRRTAETATLDRTQPYKALLVLRSPGEDKVRVLWRFCLLFHLWDTRSPTKGAENIPLWEW